MQFHIERNPHTNPSAKGLFATKKQQQAELRFGKLATSAGIEWELEAWRIYLPKMNCYFTPDYRLRLQLPNHDYVYIFVEVTLAGGTDRTRRHRHLGPKRAKIKEARENGVQIVMLDAVTWPLPRIAWADVELQMLEAFATAVHTDKWHHEPPISTQ